MDGSRRVSVRVEIAIGRARKKEAQLGVAADESRVGGRVGHGVIVYNVMVRSRQREASKPR